MQTGTPVGAAARPAGGGTGTGGSQPATSFLFFVQALGPLYSTEMDNWGSRCPPTDWRNYPPPNHQSAVMRYCDGRVTALANTEYLWLSAGSGFGVGGMLYRSRDWQVAHEYSVATLFSCGHPLPVVAVRCDATRQNTNRYNSRTENDPTCTWSLLHFWNPGPEDPGAESAMVSRVTTMLRDCTGRTITRPFVSGANPSWMPSLVPRFFENPDPDADDSGGLGGELALLIGLMAFQCQADEPSAEGSVSYGEDPITKVFSGTAPMWQDNRWSGSHPSGHVLDNLASTPRGFIVRIFLDSFENPAGSTLDRLADLERTAILVRE